MLLAARMTLRFQAHPALRVTQIPTLRTEILRTLVDQGYDGAQRAVEAPWLTADQIAVILEADVARVRGTLAHAGDIIEKRRIGRVFAYRANWSVRRPTNEPKPEHDHAPT